MFLGNVGCYWNLIENINMVALPLFKLLKNNFIYVGMMSGNKSLTY